MGASSFIGLRASVTCMEIVLDWLGAGEKGLVEALSAIPTSAVPPEHGIANVQRANCVGDLVAKSFGIDRISLSWL